jgi:predicted short-subunit dehydrogenase-like oxidoreductase (DUF2520 family)
VTTEVFNALTAFISGFIVCAFALHKAIRKETLKQQYEKGKHDGINEIWPHLIRAWADNILLSSRLTKYAPPSGRSESKQVTH